MLWTWFFFTDYIFNRLTGSSYSICWPDDEYDHRDWSLVIFLRTNNFRWRNRYNRLICFESHIFDQWQWSLWSSLSLRSHPICQYWFKRISRLYTFWSMKMTMNIVFFLRDRLHWYKQMYWRDYPFVNRIWTTKMINSVDFLFWQESALWTSLYLIQSPPFERSQ